MRCLSEQLRCFGFLRVYMDRVLSKLLMMADKKGRTEDVFRAPFSQLFV